MTMLQIRMEMQLYFTYSWILIRIRNMNLNTDIVFKLSLKEVKKSNKTSTKIFVLIIFYFPKINNIAGNGTLIAV
jgi:hypothetical protein